MFSTERDFSMVVWRHYFTVDCSFYLPWYFLLFLVHLPRRSQVVFENFGFWKTMSSAEEPCAHRRHWYFRRVCEIQQISLSMNDPFPFFFHKVPSVQSWALFFRETRIERSTYLRTNLHKTQEQVGLNQGSLAVHRVTLARGEATSLPQVRVPCRRARRVGEPAGGSISRRHRQR